MMEEFNRSAATMGLFLRYTQALITQMAQTAVCNRECYSVVKKEYLRLLPDRPAT
jgi:hypothetical protein